MTRLGKFSIATEYFYVTKELAKARRNYVATKQFYVATELARVERISVMTKDFIVTTNLATTESSVAQDIAGHAKAGLHDSVAHCCVATKEATCARQALGAHDRGTRVTDLDSDQKKKKFLENWGIIAWYQGLDLLISRAGYLILEILRSVGKVGIPLPRTLWA